MDSQFIIWTNKELAKTIRTYCEEEDCKISSLFRKAVRQYLRSKE